MKLLRYGPKGKEKPGILDTEGNIRDLSNHLDDIDGLALTSSQLNRVAAIELSSLDIIASETRIGACIGRVGKFICIGLNYADHAEESNMPIPTEPVIFNKWTSAVSGPFDEIVKPLNSTKLDWEVELGIVIGSNCAYVQEHEAEKHIAGYCVVNDVSERAFQLERGGQWDKGKGCDTFGPIGPWLVTKDEIKDVKNLDMHLDVNGVRRQTGNTKTMIFSPNFIVSYVSQFMSLQPGDIISTGTPPGVGMGFDPQIFLNAGDTIELSIEGLGLQRQDVVSFK